MLLLTPFIMAFVLPSYAVAKFVEDVTVSEDGVGDVCAFSMMNLKRHGDAARLIARRGWCGEHPKVLRWETREKLA